MAEIMLRDVAISFARLDHASRSLKNSMFSRRRRGLRGSASAQRFYALQNINLTMSDGDRVGLLGRNGAGKSTLLRVLSSVYDPDNGTVEISGKASSLLSLNLGIYPDLDGIENIRTSSLLYGAHYGQIDDICRDVSEFTQLGDALNRPVRTYSAGMLMRLGFGVATAVDPEILLLDEVVGVGDWTFAERALKRVEALIGSVNILVLASHDDSALRRFCTRGVVLDGGEIVFDGPLEEALTFYNQG